MKADKKKDDLIIIQKINKRTRLKIFRPSQEEGGLIKKFFYATEILSYIQVSLFNIFSKKKILLFPSENLSWKWRKDKNR